MVQERTDDAVTCEFQMTQSEAVPVLRWTGRRRPSLVLLKLAGLVFVGLGIFKLVVGGTPVIEGFTFIYGGVMLGWVMTEILIFRAARASFRLKTWGRPHRIAIDREGLDVVGPSPYPFHRSWSEVRSVRERLGTYVISFRTNKILIIPRSAFTRPSDEARFLELAQPHPNR